MVAASFVEALRTEHPHEFRAPTAFQAGPSVLPVGEVKSHLFSSQHLFLARVTYRVPREREVEVRFPSEDYPRVAKSRYYVTGARSYRVYAYDFVTGRITRIGEWKDKSTAHQWMLFAANSPDWSLIPPTRQLMPDY